MSFIAEYQLPLAKANVLHIKRKSRDITKFRNELKGYVNDSNFQIQYNTPNGTLTPEWAKTEKKKNVIKIDLPEDEEERYFIMYNNAKQFTRMIQKEKFIEASCSRAYHDHSKSVYLFQDTLTKESVTNLRNSSKSKILDGQSTEKASDKTQDLIKKEWSKGELPNEQIADKCNSLNRVSMVAN